MIPGSIEEIRLCHSRRQTGANASYALDEPVCVCEWQRRISSMEPGNIYLACHSPWKAAIANQRRGLNELAFSKTKKVLESVCTAHDSAGGKRLNIDFALCGTNLVAFRSAYSRYPGSGHAQGDMWPGRVL